MVKSKIILVTGGNKGIGFEICRQLLDLNTTIVLISRNIERGRAAMDRLKNSNSEIYYHKLDVTSANDIHTISEFLLEKFGRFDVLINNAGILPDKQPAIETDTDVIKKTMETNVYGVFQLITTLLPLLRKSDDARIINMSSGLGALNNLGGGYAAYNLSKASLNIVTMMFASELANNKIKVNSMSPGWVRTAMGGSGAPRSVAKGAETAVWLATAENIETGKFYHNKQIIDW